MYFRTVVSLLPLLPLASAVCPGFNFGFFPGEGGWYYATTDDCNIAVSALCDNPCDCSSFGCSTFGSVNALNIDGLWYNCRDDPNKGACGPAGGSTDVQVSNRAPESCCRNDGARNKREGRIKARQAAAIAETNAILDRHIHEYRHAEKRGNDLVALRRRQETEVAESMKREAKAAAMDQNE
jgi:hypothetical protein